VSVRECRETGGCQRRVGMSAGPRAAWAPEATRMASGSHIPVLAPASAGRGRGRVHLGAAYPVGASEGHNVATMFSV
jgi:hypothetical protein